MGKRPATTVFCITRDPFASWKRTGRMLAEAKSYGLETLVCLDDRSSDLDRARITPLADQMVLWESDGYCEKAYRYVEEVRTPFFLIVSDDELPSEGLWRFAQDPPARARFGIPVIPVLGERYDRPMLGLQERLCATDGWRWVGGFEGHSEGAPQAYLSANTTGAVVWHYLLEAPLAERQEKAARYTGFSEGPSRAHTARVLYEERMSDLVPLPEQLRRFLPNLTN